MSTTQPPETESARRPLRSRQTGWAKGMAQFLARKRVSPNSISVMSVVFSTGAAVALWFLADASGLQRVWLLLAAVAGIQLRLVCNLLDGMVAVEGGLKTKSGEIFNDFPDRVSDTVILLAAGHAAHIFPYGSILGWSAALLAAFTAYVRLLGGSCGLKQNFIGPMAKQHRMAVLTLTCLLSIPESMFANLGFLRSGETNLTLRLGPGLLLWLALILINIGCVLTVFRRLSRLKRELEAR
jgi:phosphatidylglycerophosphate synthase